MHCLGLPHGSPPGKRARRVVLNWIELDSLAFHPSESFFSSDFWSTHTVKCEFCCFGVFELGSLSSQSLPFYTFLFVIFTYIFYSHFLRKKKFRAFSACSSLNFCYVYCLDCSNKWGFISPGLLRGTELGLGLCMNCMEAAKKSNCRHVMTILLASFLFPVDVDFFCWWSKKELFASEWVMDGNLCIFFLFVSFYFN